MNRLWQYVAIASTVGFLALLAMLMLLASGCAPITSTDVDNSTIQEGHMRVSDVRACGGLMVCWPWIGPHKSTVYREELAKDAKLGTRGELKVIPEQADESGLSAIENPIGTAVEHFNYGP